MGVVDPGEPAGVEQASSAEFLRRTASIMTRKAPGARATPPSSASGPGCTTSRPDHLPLVGPTRQLDGWWQANGWSGRGMLLAPYLAELLATRMATGTSPARLEMFDPDRFDPAAEIAASHERDYYARYARR